MISEVFGKSQSQKMGKNMGKTWVRLLEIASKQELEHMLHAIFEETFPKTVTVSNLLLPPLI